MTAHCKGCIQVQRFIAPGRFEAALGSKLDHSDTAVVIFGGAFIAGAGACWRFAWWAFNGIDRRLGWLRAIGWFCLGFALTLGGGLGFALSL